MKRLARLTTLMTVLVPLGLSAPGASAQSFTVSGSHLVTNPVFVASFDQIACGNGGMTEGINSNCVPIPADLGGRRVALTRTSALGRASMAICWYTADHMRVPECGDTRFVFPGAAFAGVFSFSQDADVRWTMVVE